MDTPLLLEMIKAKKLMRRNKKAAYGEYTLFTIGRGPKIFFLNHFI
jgi:hypothetical protein